MNDNEPDQAALKVDAIEALDRTITFFRETPDGWTKGAFARARHSRSKTPVSTYHPDAVCWCGLGRLHRELADHADRPAVLEIIFRGGFGMDLVSLNDRALTVTPVIKKLEDLRADVRERA